MKFIYANLKDIKNITNCVYKITNNINKKIYVGKTEPPLIFRIRRHCAEVRKGTNRYLYDAIRKYGWDNFSVEVIETNPKEDLNEREIFWIAVLKSNNKDFGYNMTEGGDGCSFTAEALKKSADLRRGKPRSDEIKRKISDGNKGKSNPMSEETKEKISKALIGRMPPNPIHKIMEGKPGARLGSKHTEASKKLMSIRQTGLPRWTAEQKAQMSIDRGGDKNPFWIDISEEKLLNLIRLNLSGKEIAKLFDVSYPTILSRIKMIGYTNLTEARNDLLSKDKKINSKLSISDVKDIKLQLEQGAKQKDLATKYGVGTQTINHIAKGRTWKDV